MGTKFFQFLKWLFGEVILLFLYLIADCLFNGRLISDGRRFQAPGDRCQQCTCERGNVRCQSSGPCPSLTCTITEQLPGECCPRCKGKGLLMADRWCTVISKWITVSQFLFAIFLFCNLQEINWFAMTYFCNQDWRYLENNMPLIHSEKYSRWRSSHKAHENFYLAHESKFVYSKWELTVYHNEFRLFMIVTGRSSTQFFALCLFIMVKCITLIK